MAASTISPASVTTCLASGPKGVTIADLLSAAPRMAVLAGSFSLKLALANRSACPGVSTTLASFMLLELGCTVLEAAFSGNHVPDILMRIRPHWGTSVA